MSVVASFTFDPLLPWPVIAGAALLIAAVLALRLRRHPGAGAVFRSVLIAGAALLVAADPATTAGRSEARRTAADVLFVVDTTASMAAEDYGPDAAGRTERPRLDGVRADIAELASHFPGAHFSLVRFDSQARIDLPWTTDAAALETAVTVIRQERAAYSRGSQLELALAAIGEQLPRPSSTGEEGYSIVFYFSDGERTADVAGSGPTLSEQAGQMLGPDAVDVVDDGSAPETFAELAALVDDGAVLGYGTAEGATMQEFVGRERRASIGDDPYLVDPATGQHAVSRADEGELRRIAADIEVPYLHRQSPGGLDELADEIREEAAEASAGERPARNRLYWIPALALVALVLWQAAVSADEAAAARRVFGSTARRGAT